ncbi:MAG TPA: hypothetical protein VGS23_00360 [Thermoplasmata archaeon]|nr:hypothetical protein [Thermoplasmata archaeon]
MKPSRVGATIAIVALALLFAGSGSLAGALEGTSSNVSTVSPHGAPLGLFTPSAIYYAGIARGLNATDRSEYNAWVLADSVIQETTILRVAHAPSDVNAADLKTAVRLSTDLNWWQTPGIQVLGQCLAGAALAGAAGCGIALTVGALTGFFAQQTGQAISGASELVVDTQLASDEDNYLNASFASLRTVLASNNGTLDFLENQASAAALSQLNYSTFDVVKVLADSGIAAELETDVQAFVAQWAGEISVMGQWGVANYGTNGRFASGGSYGLAPEAYGSPTVLCYGNCQSSPTTSPAITAAVYESLSGGNVSFYVPVGSTGGIGCNTAGGSIHMTPVDGGTAYFGTNGAPASWTSFPKGGVYNVTSTASKGCIIWGSGLMEVPSSVAGLNDQAAYFWCYSPPCSYPAGHNGLQTFDLLLGPSGPTSATGLIESASGVGAGVYNHTSSAYVYKPALKPVSYSTYVGKLMGNAALAAESYWAFLRAQGYHSIAQIPANCIIPYPSGALPQSSSNALGNATVAEDMAIYEAWLNGLATFFNTPVNSTNYCSGHPTFKGAGLLPAPNGVNATGFVYLPNATAYPHEKFGNVTTWALNGTLANRTRQSAVQMVLYPTVATVSIPVGVKYEVPKNDPIVAIAPIGYGLSFPTYYNLLGNGSAVSSGGGVVVDASTAGAAIYLTSCSVSGVAQSNCTITLQNLQGYVGNISCPMGTSGCGQQPGSPGAFSLGGLLGALGSFFCTITFGLVCGGAANLAAEVATALLVLALVVVGVVLIGDYIKRPRGGEAPPRGS